MRKYVRGIVLPILGVIILLSICAGIWGMAVIMTFINANYEQRANIAPTQTPDWVATVDAISSGIAKCISSEAVKTAVAGTMTAPGMSPEEIETAIAGTLSAFEATFIAYSTPTPK